MSTQHNKQLEELQALVTRLGDTAASNERRTARLERTIRWGLLGGLGALGIALAITVKPLNDAVAQQKTLASTDVQSLVNALNGIKGSLDNLNVVGMMQKAAGEQAKEEAKKIVTEAPEVSRAVVSADPKDWPQGKQLVSCGRMSRADDIAMRLLKTRYPLGASALAYFCQQHPVLGGFNLHLMSVSATDELVDAGRSLLIVALVGTDLHIRIFDATGEKVFDKAESELVAGVRLKTLRERLERSIKEERLSPFPDEPLLPPKVKQYIIADATSIAEQRLGIDEATLRQFEADGTLSQFRGDKYEQAVKAGTFRTMTNAAGLVNNLHEVTTVFGEMMPVFWTKLLEKAKDEVTAIVPEVTAIVRGDNKLRDNCQVLDSPKVARLRIKYPLGSYALGNLCRIYPGIRITHLDEKTLNEIWAVHRDEYQAILVQASVDTIVHMGTLVFRLREDSDAFRRWLAGGGSDRMLGQISSELHFLNASIAAMVRDMSIMAYSAGSTAGRMGSMIPW